MLQRSGAESDVTGNRILQCKFNLQHHQVPSMNVKGIVRKEQGPGNLGGFK